MSNKYKFETKIESLQAIQGFRETERKFFNKQNSLVVQRMKEQSFPSEGKEGQTLAYTHILDLADFGFIKPHIDSSRVITKFESLTSSLY